MESRPRRGVIGAGLGISISVVGWGASWTGWASPLLGWTLVTLGVVAGVVLLGWGFWPWIRARLWSGWRQLPIKVKPRLQESPRVPEELTTEQLLRIGLLHPVYLEISVKNLGSQVLSRVVGTIKLIAPDKRELESYIAWSQEPGDDFVPGGPLEVEISAGSERMARIAIAYLGMKQGWFRVHRKDPTPAGHFGAEMDFDKDIARDGIGPICTAHIILQADRYAPYSARLPIRIRQMPNGIGEPEFGDLDVK